MCVWQIVRGSVELALIHMMNGGQECLSSLNEHCRKFHRSTQASQQTDAVRDTDMLAHT